MNRFKGPALGRPTIREVAKRCGVSIGTVSNVLNGAVRVSPDTRGAVERAIAELGYTPNSFARSLRARRRVLPTTGLHAPPRLTVVGHISADYTARLDAPPALGQRTTAEVIGRTLGGPATNVAVTAAGLGDGWVTDCELVTAVGEDVDSDWALAELAERGVSTEGVQHRAGGRLCRCIVLVLPDGNRTLINETFSLSADAFAGYLAESAAPRRARHCLHLDGHQLDELLPVVRRHRECGSLTSVHATGIAEAWWNARGLDRLIDSFDVLILNRQVARRMTGQGGPDEALAQSLAAVLADPRRRRMAPCMVLLTLGAAGAALCEASGVRRAPTLTVDPVDTTGVKDVFTGVFLAAWLNQVPELRAMQCACVSASLSAGVVGAQALRLQVEQIEALADRATGAPARRATSGRLVAT